MKELFKHHLIPLLNSKPVARLANQILGSGIPVFIVHRVKSASSSYRGIDPDHLRNCLDYLLNRSYRFISVEDIINRLRNGENLPDNAVSFTMDDGFLDQAELAAPIFLEYDCPVTFFVITDMLDGTGWPWDAQISWLTNTSTRPFMDIRIDGESISLPLRNDEEKRSARLKLRNTLKEIEARDIPRLMQELATATGLTLTNTPQEDFRVMNWNQARELEEQGVCFAPHSKSHNILSKLDRQSSFDEIQGSWQKLQRELQHPLKVYCYPTGRKLDFGPREIAFLEQQGFLGAMATTPGFIKPATNSTHSLFSLPRFELPESMTDFIQYCSWLEYCRY